VSEDIALSVDKRGILGKKVKQLRAAGKIPAVIHDHGKPSIHISIDELGLKKAYSKAGKNHPVSVKIGGKDYTVLIKEVVYAPATSFIQHAVFQAVKADEKVSAEIPVHLTGDAPAEIAGLQVLKKLEHINVDALPKNLPESFEVDISGLEKAGDRLHISDIALPSTVEVKDEPANLIAIVEEPRVHETEDVDAQAAESEEAEEGEAADVPSEHGTDESEASESEGEIRPGGKKEKEDKSQGHNPEKQ
jgi:large subunit ribosomal protein L25